MSNLTAIMSMSLDGFVAVGVHGPDTIQQLLNAGLLVLGNRW